MLLAMRRERLQSAEFVLAPPIPTAGNLGPTEQAEAVIVTVTIGETVHRSMTYWTGVVNQTSTAHVTMSGLSGTEAKHCQ